MIIIHTAESASQAHSPDFFATSGSGTAVMSNKKRNPHIGSSLDDFLKEEGTFEELQAQAIKEVVTWQLEEVMKAEGVEGSVSEDAAHEPDASEPAT